MNAALPITEALPAAVPFNPDAKSYAAYRLGATELLGALAATTLDGAQAEATERWHWDRGGRLGIREIGQEDAPTWPFDKQPIDRLHVYAIQRSAPLRWQMDNYGRSHPVYKFSLKHICTIDVKALAL